MTGAAPYTKIAAFADEIDNACIYNHNQEQFLSYTKINNFVTKNKEGVTAAFKEANILDHKTLVDYVLQQAPRLFLILILMSTRVEEKLSLINDLKNRRFTDSSLPIDFNRNPETNGISLEARDNPTQFILFNHWERRDRDIFESYQWRFLVPVFKPGNFRYTFAPKQRLPFMKIAPKPTNSGFFGEVSRILVHPEHITGFQLEVVSNYCPQVILAVL